MKNLLLSAALGLEFIEFALWARPPSGPARRPRGKTVRRAAARNEPWRRPLFSGPKEGGRLRACRNACEARRLDGVSCGLEIFRSIGIVPMSFRNLVLRQTPGEPPSCRRPYGVKGPANRRPDQSLICALAMDYRSRPKTMRRAAGKETDVHSLFLKRRRCIIYAAMYKSVYRRCGTAALGCPPGPNTEGLVGVSHRRGRVCHMARPTFYTRSKNGRMAGRRSSHLTGSVRREASRAASELLRGKPG